MSDYTQEQFDQLPDFAKADFVKDGDVYRHGGFLKVKKTADGLDQKFREANDRISSIEASKAEEIEAAKAAALEQARTKGDVTAIEKRYQEQMADLEKRNADALKEREAKIEGLVSASKNSAIGAMVSDLSGLATDDGREAFKRLIRNRIDYNPETGQTIYLDDSGSATSLDFIGFKAETLKDPLFKSLLKADSPTNGGGQVGGSGNASGAQPKTIPRAKFESMSQPERMAFSKAGGRPV
jgi:hypothetical protein